MQGAIVHPNPQINQLIIQHQQPQIIQPGNQAVPPQNQVIAQPQINPDPNPRLERGRLFCI
jgi:hypothetical protein